MRRTVLFFIVFLLSVMCMAQRRDERGRKIISSVRVESKHGVSVFRYSYFPDGFVASVTSDINIDELHAKSVLATTTDYCLVQSSCDDGVERAYTLVDGRIIAKSEIDGRQSKVYEHIYSDTGQLLMSWYNYRLRNGDEFDYEMSVSRNEYIYSHSGLTDFMVWNYKYLKRPVSEDAPFRIVFDGLITDGEPNTKKLGSVFGNRLNDTNLDLSAFIPGTASNFMYGSEYTCDWMGTRSDKLVTRLNTGNSYWSNEERKFIDIHLVVKYHEDTDGNISTFSIFYDHKLGDIKPNDVQCTVFVEYVM